MEPRIEYSPLIQQAGKPLYNGLFCASSDENIQGKSTSVLAQGVDFAWIFEEHRDSDRSEASGTPSLRVKRSVTYCNTR